MRHTYYAVVKVQKQIQTHYIYIFNNEKLKQCKI